MNKMFRYIFSAVALTTALVSCSEEEAPVVNGASFEISTYDDFLWKKDPVDTVKFVLDTEFIECEEMGGSIVLALCDSDQEYVSTDVATLYVNGEKTLDNRISIPVEDGVTATSVGIVLNRESLAEDITYNWHITVCDDAGLEKLYGENNGVRTLLRDDEPWIYGMDIQIRNVHVANSLKVWTNIILLLILAVILAWHIMSRIVNQAVKFTRLIIEYPDGEVRYNTRGCYKVVLTDKPMKVSLLHRFFVGNVCFVRNDFWTAEITMKKGFGNNIRIMTRGDYVLPDESLRKEEFVIKNEAGSKAVLLTN